MCSAFSLFILQPVQVMEVLSTDKWNQPANDWLHCENDSSRGETGITHGCWQKSVPHISSGARWRFEKNIELNYCNAELKTANKYAYQPASPVPKITLTHLTPHSEQAAKEGPKTDQSIQREVFGFSLIMSEYKSPTSAVTRENLMM